MPNPNPNSSAGASYGGGALGVNLSDQVHD